MDARILSEMDENGRIKEFEYVPPLQQRMKRARKIMRGRTVRREGADFVCEIEVVEFALLPEVSRDVRRHNTRMIGIYDFLLARKSISGSQAMAGHKMTELWVCAHRDGSVTAKYGQGTGATTLVRHMSDAELAKLDYKEKCRLALIKAQRAVNDDREWKALTLLAQRDATMEDVGFALGAMSAPTAQRWGPKAVKSGLAKLAKHWGYS